jgi:hypothetical protein
VLLLGLADSDERRARRSRATSDGNDDVRYGLDDGVV